MNYLTRHPQGVWIGGPDQVVSTGLKQYINACCIQYLSTYDGRRDAARKQLNRTQLVPIVVGPETTLLPVHALRHSHAVFLRHQSILEVTALSQGCRIDFLDGTATTLDVPVSHIRNMMRLSEELTQYSGFF